MGKFDAYNSDTLLKDLGGCGTFQVLITILIDLTSISAYLGFHAETFGIYNPGWRCVGNHSTYYDSYTHDAINASGDAYEGTAVGGWGGGGGGGGGGGAATTSASSSNRYGWDVSVNATNNGTSAHDRMWTEYGIHTCEAFKSCPNVEFSPDASTILTEWGLTCDRGWILSTMISIRMAGYLCSTLVAGYVGDRFGRRIPYLVSRFLIIVINLGMMFSVSWQMYATLSFALGFVGAYGLLGGVLMTEYMSPDWRIKLYTIPIWSVFAIMAGLLAMAIHDWRMLRLIVVVTGVVGFIPMVLFTPESLRWLSVNGNPKTLKKLISKIARINKAPLPPDEKIESMVERLKEEKKSSNTVFHLFKKGYRFNTIILGFVHFSTDVTYFAFNFGVATLPGNFYTNLMIFSATDLPVYIVAYVVGSRFARKPTMIWMYGLGAACIFGIVAADRLATGDARTYSINVLVMVAKLFLYVGWIVLSTAQVEAFPTVIRSTVSSFGFFCASLGGMFSPYLIPSDPRTFYISYLAMGVLVLACTGLIAFFPETKGKPMKDGWDDDDDNNKAGGGNNNGKGDDNDDDNDDDDDHGMKEAFIPDGGDKTKEHRTDKNSVV